MDYDVAVHNTRVFADNGTVPDNITTDRYVRLLKQANLWDSCVFFGAPNLGVKKDGNQYVSKVYDLKANADLFQATGTAQPKYQTNGSLLYDGGDKIQSNNLTNTNPIDMCRSSITVICWVNITTSGYQFIFDRYDAGNASDAWHMVQKANATLGVGLISGASKFIKNYDTVDAIGTGWKHLAFSYSIGTGLKLYINGVEKSVTKTTDNSNVAIQISTMPITLGARRTYAGNPYLSGNKTALPQIYNSTLTAEQILWNYNNIRPEGV